MILGAFTSLLGVGGVERMARHSAAVLVSISQDRGEPYRLLGLNDPPGRHRIEVGGLAFDIHGFGRRKTKFAWSVFAAAPRTSVAYLGHPQLAPLGLMFRVLRPAARYRVAVHVHGIEAWKRLSFMRRLGLRLADTVTASSEFTMGKAITIQKSDPHKTTVLAPALEPGFRNMIGDRKGPTVYVPSQKVLLTVARLDAVDEQKGMETVIKALPIILSVVPEACYVIIGDGNDRERLERLSAETGVKHRVVVAGRRTDEEMAGYYAGCDVFVMPSRKEGFGIVFVEAMALGKPVIGGDHAGAHDLIEQGVTGFLVKYNDINALADRLISLLGNQELRKRMGDAGRKCVENNYTFEHFRMRLTRALAGNGIRASNDRFCVSN